MTLTVSGLLLPLILLESDPVSCLTDDHGVMSIPNGNQRTDSFRSPHWVDMTSSPRFFDRDGPSFHNHDSCHIIPCFGTTI